MEVIMSNAALKKERPDENVTKKRDDYLNALKRIFSDIEKWAKESGLKIKKEKFSITEEQIGPYDVPCLRLLDKSNKEIAVLRPVGAFIIGASGRFDMEGRLDKETIILMGKGGPVFETKISQGGNILEKSKTHLFRGIDKDGWYWIESKKLGRARLFDRELFLDLIREISDYES